MISNEINLERLNSLSPEERALALEILKEYSQEGYSSILEENMDEAVDRLYQVLMKLEMC